MEHAAFPLEIKELSEEGVIAGLGAAFGNVDLGGDRIVPGAFRKTLAERGDRPIPMLMCHDAKRPLGAWSKARETAQGLEVEGRLTLEAPEGKAALALARDGALSGLSIGYLPGRHGFVGEVRELHEIKLLEISLTPLPMNEAARVHTVKTIANVRDIAEVLRERGMSGRKAKAAAAAAWKAITDSDNEAAADAELAQILAASTARLSARGGR